MAIVWVHEALPSGGGVGEHDAGNSYTRVFDVLTDSYADNKKTVESAEDPDTGLKIPAAYSYFQKGNDTDYGSVVTRITSERDDRQPLLWHVTVEYTWMRGNQSGGTWPSGSIDLTYALPEVNIWPIAVTEILDKDINGVRIANAAGRPYNPRPEDVRYITAIEIKWFIRNYNFDNWDPYADSTNAASVWNRAPNTLLMIGHPRASRRVDQIGTYYEIRGEFHYDKTGWKRSFFNGGRVRLAQDNGDPPSASQPATGVVPIMDNFGLPVNEDVPLDAAGQPLGPNDPPVWNEYIVKEPRDWGPMNLPALNVTF